MSVMETILEIVPILENSPRIVVFCAERGLDSHRVVWPGDDQNPLGEDSTPFIELNPLSGAGGLGAEQTQRAFEMDVAITHPDAKVGTKLVTDFFSLVLDVLVKNRIEIEFVDYLFDLSGAEPMRIIFSNISVNQSRPMGRDNII